MPPRGTPPPLDPAEGHVVGHRVEQGGEVLVERVVETELPFPVARPGVDRQVVHPTAVDAVVVGDEVVGITLDTGDRRHGLGHVDVGEVGRTESEQIEQPWTPAGVAVGGHLGGDAGGETAVRELEELVDLVLERERSELVGDGVVDGGIGPKGRCRRRTCRWCVGVAVGIIGTGAVTAGCRHYEDGEAEGEVSQRTSHQGLKRRRRALASRTTGKLKTGRSDEANQRRRRGR